MAMNFGPPRFTSCCEHLIGILVEAGLGATGSSSLAHTLTKIVLAAGQLHREEEAEAIALLSAVEPATVLCQALDPNSRLCDELNSDVCSLLAISFQYQDRTMKDKVLTNALRALQATTSGTLPSEEKRLVYIPRSKVDTNAACFENAQDLMRGQLISIVVDSAEAGLMLVDEYCTSLLESLKPCLMVKSIYVRNNTCKLLVILTRMEQYAEKCVTLGVIDYVYELLRQTNGSQDSADADCTLLLLKAIQNISAAHAFRNTLSYGLCVILDAFEQAETVDTWEICAAVLTACFKNSLTIFDESSAEKYFRTMSKCFYSGVLTDCTSLANLLQWYRVPSTLRSLLIDLLQEVFGSVGPTVNFLRCLRLFEDSMLAERARAGAPERNYQAWILNMVVEHILPLFYASNAGSDELPPAPELWIELFELISSTLDPDFYDDREELRLCAERMASVMSFGRALRQMQSFYEDHAAVIACKKMTGLLLSPLSSPERSCTSVPMSYSQILERVSSNDDDALNMLEVSLQYCNDFIVNPRDLVPCLYRALHQLCGKEIDLRVLRLLQKCEALPDVINDGNIPLPEGIIAQATEAKAFDPLRDPELVRWLLYRAQGPDEFEAILMASAAFEPTFERLHRAFLTALREGLHRNPGAMNTLVNLLSSKAVKMSKLASRLCEGDPNFSDQILRQTFPTPSYTNLEILQTLISAYENISIESIDRLPRRHTIGFLMGLLVRENLNAVGIRFIRVLHAKARECCSRDVIEARTIVCFISNHELIPRLAEMAFSTTGI